MRIQKAIEELTALSKRCNTQTYVSHHSIERQLKKLPDTVWSNESAENPESLNTFQTLKNELEHTLKQLKKSNQKMIKALDFEKTCYELIKANDRDNLKGLIDIGEYFGTGPRGQDVTVALDRVYDFYRTHPKERETFYKPCLDALSDIVHQPRLPLPTLNVHWLADPRKQLKIILDGDTVNDLMVWLASAKQEDCDFALRCAAAVDTCRDCLLFLLQLTAPAHEGVRINLLEAGKPSGQIITSSYFIENTHPCCSFP